MPESLLDVIRKNYHVDFDTRLSFQGFKLTVVPTNRYQENRVKYSLNIPKGLAIIKFIYQNNEIDVPPYDDYSILKHYADEYLEKVSKDKKGHHRSDLLLVIIDAYSKLTLSWNPTDKYWVAIDFVKSSEFFSTKLFPKVKIELDSSRDSCLEDTQAMVVYYWILKQQTKAKSNSEGYIRFVNDSLRPFVEFLDSEKEALVDNRFRPMCRYQKTTKYAQLSAENYKYDSSDLYSADFLYLELFDPPRMLTNPLTSVMACELDKEGKIARIFGIARAEDYSDEGGHYLVFQAKDVDNWPLEGVLAATGDLASNRKKEFAVKLLKQGEHPHLQRLRDILIRPQAFPGVETIHIVPTSHKFDRSNSESQNQSEAIDLALSTPDIAIIQGPPGTGKTEVICEIIKQAIRNNGRVLLAAPAHVAVDNVLERLEGYPGLSPIRIGIPRKVIPKLRKFLLSSKITDWKEALIQIKTKVDQSTSLAGIVSPDSNIYVKLQKDFFDQFQKEDPNAIKQLIVDQANLVCGTTIGIANFYFSRASEEDPFDLLIIDEASKTTLLEFLVPAVRARRWILVGDHRQLAPYVNDFELKVYLQRFVETMHNTRSTIQNQDEETKNADFSKIQHPVDRKMNLKKVEQEGLERAYTSLERSVRFKFDSEVDIIISSLRRYHEEEHVLEGGTSEPYLRQLVEFLKYDRKAINSLLEMVEYALGSVFHYFHRRVDESRIVSLPVQHRMPLEIAEFLNTNIYQGYFRTAYSSSIHGFEINLSPSFFSNYKLRNPFVFVSTSLTDSREKEFEEGQYYNPAEAQVIVELVKELVATYPYKLLRPQNTLKFTTYSSENPFEIGIITYYAKQAETIAQMLYVQALFNPVRDTIKRKYPYQELYHGITLSNVPIKIRVSIVDRFQGQEMEIIILSLTRSNDHGRTGFLKNMQRINVSLSRAKHNLFVVGDFNFFRRLKAKRGNDLLIALIRYAEEKGQVVNFAETRNNHQHLNSKFSKRPMKKYQRPNVNGKKQNTTSSFSNPKFSKHQNNRNNKVKDHTLEEIQDM